MPADRDDRDILPQAIVAAFALPLFFLLIYAGCGYLTAGRQNIASFTFSWETRIPLIEWMLLPYLSLHPLFIASLFASQTRAQLHTLLARLSLAITLAAIGFLAWPMQPPSPRIRHGLLAPAYHLLWKIDPSHNAFPSLHIAITIILWFHLKRFPWPVHIWLALVLASPLLTRQHQLIDILGGAALAFLCLYLIPLQINSSRRFFSRRNSKNAPGPNNHSAAVAPNATPVQVPRSQ